MVTKLGMFKLVYNTFIYVYNKYMVDFVVIHIKMEFKTNMLLFTNTINIYIYILPTT